MDFILHDSRNWQVNNGTRTDWAELKPTVCPMEHYIVANIKLYFC